MRLRWSEQQLARQRNRLYPLGTQAAAIADSIAQAKQVLPVGWCSGVRLPPPKVASNQAAPARSQDDVATTFLSHHRKGLEQRNRSNIVEVKLLQNLTRLIFGTKQDRYSKKAAIESKRQTVWARRSFMATVGGLVVTLAGTTFLVVQAATGGEEGIAPSIVLSSYAPLSEMVAIDLSDVPAIDPSAECASSYDGRQSVYPVDPLGEISVSAPDLNSVVIRGVTVTVLHEEEVPNHAVLLECNSEKGGAIIGSILRVDLSRPNGPDVGSFVKVNPETLGEILYPIPPASFDLNGRTFETILLQPVAKEGVATEFIVELDVLFDDQPEAVTLGTVAKPLRALSLSERP